MERLFATVDAGFPNEDGSPRHPGATVVSPYSEHGASQIARQGPLAGRVAATCRVGIAGGAAAIIVAATGRSAEYQRRRRDQAKPSIRQAKLLARG